MIFEQQPAVTIDATQRRFQIVSHGIRERLQFSTLSIECRSARSNAFFQLSIEKVKSLFGTAAPAAFHQQYRYESRLQNKECECSDYPPLVKLPKSKLLETHDAVRWETALRDVPAS